jgi:hypothetical protein
MLKADASLCATCGAAGDKRCSACISVRYCGAACQRAHWPQHRAACRATVAAARANSAASTVAAVFAADTRARAAAMSVRELRAALAARGASAEGLLEKEDLVAALLAAPELPRGAAGTGGAGGGRRGGVGLAMPDGMGGVNMQEMDDLNQSAPLSRAELLELVDRKGRRSPTMGDALRYGTLFMRLASNVGGAHEEADSCLAFIKMVPAGPMLEKLLSRLLDATGTTAGVGERWQAILRESGVRA